jgi:hypothetical protein
VTLLGGVSQPPRIVLCRYTDYSHLPGSEFAGWHVASATRDVRVLLSIPTRGKLFLVYFLVGSEAKQVILEFMIASSYDYISAL